MRTIRVDHFINILGSTIGVRGAKDNLHHWLETSYSSVTSRSWQWNWRFVNIKMPAEITEDKSFTWTKGDDYITFVGSLTALNTTHTGRKVLLGDKWYRVLDIGVKNSNRIYVEGFIDSSESDGVSCTFNRDEAAVRSSAIRKVSSDQWPKLMRYSEDYFNQLKFSDDIREYDQGEPQGYIDHNDREIEPPAFPPLVTQTATPGAISVGDYYYFYVRVDLESGQESPPGPVVKFTATTTDQIQVQYDNNTVLDQSENTTYHLRLYRSRVNPSRERCPMFRIQERAPGVPGSPFLDNTSGQMYNREAFWDGQWTVLQLVYRPDSEIRNLRVEHLRNSNMRLRPEDKIRLGPANEVDDLIHLYVAGKHASLGKDPSVARAHMIEFNKQLNYYLSTSNDAGATDSGPENYDPIIPGDGSSDHADRWIATMSWSGQ